MAIIRWEDPFALIKRMSWPTIWGDDDEIWPEERQGLTVYETDNEVVVKANIAGVPAEKVDISLEGGVLTIKAEHQESEEEKKKKKVIYRQAREARYCYTTSLPAPVKTENAKAEVKDGVVTVTLTKKEEAKPIKIKAKSNQ